MGVIPSSQACVCTVAAFLTTCTGCTGVSRAIHVPFTQKGDPPVQAKCAPFESREDQSLSGCSVDVASWIWGSGWPKGTRVRSIHGRVELLFSFVTLLPRSIIEIIHG